MLPATSATERVLSPSAQERVARFLRRRARLLRFLTTVVVGVPALAGLWGLVGILSGAATPTRLDLGLLLGMYVLTGLGVHLGAHRCFSHRAFTPAPPLEVALAVASNMAGQGPVTWWAAKHRRHHAHAETPEDAHSPYRFGPRGWPLVRGLLHAHVGWLWAMSEHMSSAENERSRFAPDLLQRPLLLALDRHYFALVLSGLLLPGLVAGALTGSAEAAGSAVFWAGLVRMTLVHQATWSVNSIGHVWGGRPFAIKDRSTNNALVALFTFGDGWHNNHHAFPWSARHGLGGWWQIDPAYWTVKLWGALGWVSKIKVPTAEQLRRREPVP